MWRPSRAARTTTAAAPAADLPAAIYDNRTVAFGADPFNFLPAGTPVGGAGPCTTQASTCFYYPFTVNATVNGTVAVTGSLSWTLQANDFDFYLYDTAGNQVIAGASDVTTGPGTQEALAGELVPGDYQVYVVAWLVVNDTYSLAVTFA